MQAQADEDITVSMCERASGEHSPDEYSTVIHAGKSPAAEHFRKYNGPIASEVAKIVPEPEDGEVRGRNIILRRRAALLNTGIEALHRRPISHRSYNPLSEVLFFPYGDNSWHFQLRRRSGGTNNEEGSAEFTSILYYPYKVFQRRQRRNLFNT